MPRTSSRHRAQAVTTARRSQDEDRTRRMRQYLLAMGIRTACFPLAVWAFVSGRYVLAWVAALGAALIPSFAVMLANAVDRRQAPDEDVIASPVRGLGPGGGATPEPGPEAGPDGEAPPAPAGTPIQGTVVSSRDTAYPAPDPDPPPANGEDER